MLYAVSVKYNILHGIKWHSKILVIFVIFTLNNFAFARNRVHVHSDIVFPEPIEAPRDVYTQHSPLALARMLNKIRTREELLQLFPSEDLLEGGSVAQRFGIGSSDSSSKNLTMLPTAHCTPELQLVPVKTNANSGALYFPQCTRLNRCGGCCNNDLLSCQPTTLKMNNYQIYEITPSKGKGNGFMTKKQVVTLEEHVSCECRCIVKEEHCTSKQYYSGDACACLCKNTQLEKHCSEEYEMKFWNSTTCTCQCRRSESCGTNFFFDNKRCRCERILWPNY